jgi:polar amino acid transport system permease protein
MGYTFHFGIVLQKLPYLLEGVFLTLRVMAVSFAFAFAIGLLVGAFRLSKHRYLTIPAAAYVEVCRNTPALVQLIWIFYCLPLFTGIDIDPTTASIIALAINAGAYMAEDFRAGIQSVDRGQVEAARSLGMSHRQTMQKIVVPQAVRVLIPPLVNHAVSLMKWSALVSVLGVADLTYRAQVLSTQTFRPLEIFTATGIVYFAMSITLSYVVRKLERRWAMKY